MGSVETIQCPYCWEPIEIEVFPSDSVVEYTEDCPVCCHPIAYKISYSDECVSVEVDRES